MKETRQQSQRAVLNFLTTYEYQSNVLTNHEVVARFIVWVLKNGTYMQLVLAIYMVQS